MATAKQQPNWKVLGTRPIRHDGTDKVTGRAKYGADVQMAGLLHGRFLRSPHSHANIKAIDISKAAAYPGVKAVITADHLPSDPEGPVTFGDQYLLTRHTYMYEKLLARDKVLYKGHPIAAVAALNPHIAEEALALIQVEYEPLPSILDGREAMKEDAVLLHHNLTTREFGEDTGRNSNIANHVQLAKGNIEDGFAKADVIIERDFHTASVHQGYIEPHNSTALWDTDGHITIWSSTQGAFDIRSQTAEFLGVDISSVTVMPVEIGGGFGGKVVIYMEPIAALLSRNSGHRPVKMVMDRAEVFEATGPTSGSYLRVKVGATKQGRLTAAEAYMVYEAGAYPGSPMGGAVRVMLAPYNLENLTIDAYDVVVNRPKTGPYRAPGVTNAAFAVETVIDEICEQISMDPLEFRLHNALREGDRKVDGTVVNWTIGNMEVHLAAKDSSHYNAPIGGKSRGRGVASGAWHTLGFDSSCNMSVNTDGTISLAMGSVDIGGARTAMAMVVAEVLEIPAEDVHPTIPSTDLVGFTRGTVGSRTAFATGWAVYEGAQDIKQQLIERVAKIWGSQPSDVETEAGTFRHKADTELTMTFKELTSQLLSTGGAIVGTKMSSAPMWGGDTFVTHIVDVEVDPETGKVDILRYTAIQDVGKAIHPAYVEGQMQGGAVQGIGWALNEEYSYNDQGGMTNATFLDYRIPTALDVPMIETILVEVPHATHPLGVRGVGEPPIVPPPAAIANAIYNAVGIRMTELPMSPPRVLQALWNKRGSSAKFGS
jgi:xanthine dehydrogenase molybdenum-binding subunit